MTFDRNKPLRPILRGATVVACGVLLGVCWALSRWPAFVEDVYARRAGAFVARVLSRASGVVPVSLAEMLIVGLAIYVSAATVVALGRIVLGRRGVMNLLAVASLRVAAWTAVVVVAFYLSWGMNYARAPLADRLGWAQKAPSAEAERAQSRVRERAEVEATDELVSIARQLVVATNVSYRAFAGSDDLGAPSAIVAEAGSIDRAIEAAYRRVQARLALDSAFARARGPAKPVALSVAMNYLRITGFYFPFTGEASYNRLAPASSLPHSIAHEKAHQRGIALEDEANFIGYLACVMSDDAYARYAGYLFAQRQLLGEVAARDLPRARGLVGARLKGVQRDIDASVAFWRQYEGAAARASERVNDRYLRAQGERRGVAAYAASRHLIVLFARSNGGLATVERPK
jgi:Protein of unknown function (DUF3810)